jgi:hypothetical protein
MSATDQTFSENLFSYGTRQLEQVQRATFGRKLEGRADQMPGYSLTTLKIEDPEVASRQAARRIIPWSLIAAIRTTR